MHKRVVPSSNPSVINSLINLSLISLQELSSLIAFILFFEFLNNCTICNNTSHQTNEHWDKSIAFTVLHYSLGDTVCRRGFLLRQSATQQLDQKDLAIIYTDCWCKSGVDNFKHGEHTSYIMRRCRALTQQSLKTCG